MINYEWIPLNGKTEFFSAQSEYRFCYERARELSDYIVSLDDDYTRIAGVSYDREAGQRDPETEKALMYVIAKDEAIEEMTALNKRRLTLKPVILNAINGTNLSDEHQSIARRKYVDFAKEKQIAPMAGYSLGHVYKLLREADKVLDKTMLPYVDTE